MNKDSTTITLRWLFFIQLVSIGAMEMSSPFWAQHFQQVATLTPSELAWVSGMAYAGPMFMTMLFAPLWGKIGDRVGQKPMLIRALLALALTQCGIALSDDVIIILIMRLLQGALAGFIATSQAYGSVLVDRDQRGSLMARLQMATALGVVLGPMIGGYVYSRFGFNQVNLTASVLCAACTIFATVYLPPLNTIKKASAHPETDAGSKYIWLSPMAGLLLAIVLVQSAKMMPQVFFSIYAATRLHASPWLIGVCYGAMALGLCLAAPFWANRFKKMSRQAIMREVEYCCWACAMLLSLQTVGDHVWLFIVSRILWGVFLAALLPVFYTLLSHDIASTRQGFVLGLGNSAAKAGALVGILIGSAGLAFIPVENLFWLVSITYVVCALVIRYQRLPAQAADNNVPA